MPSKPFVYRFPVGLILLAIGIPIALFSVFVLGPMKERRLKKAVVKAASNPHYMHALKMTEWVETRDEDGDIDRFRKHEPVEAIDYLVSKGISRDKARAVYRALADERDAR